MIISIVIIEAELMLCYDAHAASEARAARCARQYGVNLLASGAVAPTARIER
jgi:hypothetical protein